MDLTPFECFNYVQQEFLICVTVHKARNLCLFNTDTYVKVTIDKKHKTTAIYKNSENPYFNEYFVFEIFCSLPELLRLTVLFEIKKKSCCADTNIGELFIDLAAVWNQPGHQFYKKWGRLENPIGKTSNKPRGHLQIDLSIVSKTEPPASAQEEYDYDDIEKHLLGVEDTTQIPCNVRYHITIYSGIFMKKADYLVQVSFAGTSAKTKTIKSTLRADWNEEIRVNWYYPSLAKIFFIQVMSREILQWKCTTDYEIHFDEICFPGCLPCLGPTYIHLYDSLDSHKYIGKLLLQIKSENIGSVVANVRRDICKTFVPPLIERIYWNDENFVAEALFWRGDFIHVKNNSNMKLSIDCGEWKSNVIDFFLHNYENSDLKFFQQDLPHKSVYLNSYFPDCREKLRVESLLIKFTAFIKNVMENFKTFRIQKINNLSTQAKCLKNIIKSFKEQIHNIEDQIDFKGSKKLTEWDKSLRMYLDDFLKTILDDLQMFRINLKKKKNLEFAYDIDMIHQNLMIKIKDIENVLSLRIQDNWPEMILNLWVGGSIVANCKLDPKIYMYSQNPQFCGNLCGKRQTIVFKPLNCPHTCECCGCVFGKLDGWIWIGTAIERSQCSIRNGWVQKESRFYYVDNETHFDCNVYIHQAKIRPGSDVSGLCDPKVRVTFLHHQQETTTIYATLAPVWNEVVKFKNLIFYAPVEYYVENPPMIALELFDIDSKTEVDYLGCCILKLAVKPLKDTPLLAPLKVLYERNLLDDEEDIDSDTEERDKIESKNKTLENKTETLFDDKPVKISKELQAISKRFPPPLKWIPITTDGTVLAEILVSAELIEVPSDTNDVLPNNDVVENIPNEILPVMSRYKVDVTFVGIRNWHKKFNLLQSKYKIKCLFGDLSVCSGESKKSANENLNFTDPYVTGICNLPTQLEYWPPIIFIHIEKTKKTRYCDVTIGAALISTAFKYIQDDKCGKQDSRINISKSVLTNLLDEKIPLIGKKKAEISRLRLMYSRTQMANNKIQAIVTDKFQKLKTTIKRKSRDFEFIAMNSFHHENEYNWWTKFYNSLKPEITASEIHDSQQRKHRLTVYLNELEKQPEFSYFQDWAESTHMLRGAKKRKVRNKPQEESYCTLKYKVKIRNCEYGVPFSDSALSLKVLASKYEDLNFISEETRVYVRVYIVRGLHLRSHQAHSPADPYLKLQFGSQKINDRVNYQQNQTNPVFGKIFEFEGVIPREINLHVSVYNHGCIDDLIGCTSIDLEDRFRSQHRAGMGIAREFNKTGYNAWRDYSSPKEILNEICMKYGISPPILYGKKIEVDGVLFEDSTEISKDEDLQERLSLSVLHRLNEVPSVGFKIVPEHVETRSLFRNDRPGIEQGKLQMWVEIYEYDKIPYPLDVTPIQINAYELRVIIWNTADVILEETNIFGTKMSDIYLKGWLADPDLAQYTDIHYRSLTGAGNFNWRMIFPLRYSKEEEMRGRSIYK